MNPLESEFLMSLSHELQTRLNSIIGFSELRKHGLVGAMTTRQLAGQGDAGDRAASAVTGARHSRFLSKQAPRHSHKPWKDQELSAIIAELLGYAEQSNKTGEYRLISGRRSARSVIVAPLTAPRSAVCL